jgi:hypothetical protein
MIGIPPAGTTVGGIAARLAFPSSGLRSSCGPDGVSPVHHCLRGRGDELHRQSIPSLTIIRFSMLDRGVVPRIAAAG